MQDEGDVYNRISGSTGIMAVSDSTFMIEKKNRSDENATMHLIGRDIDQKDFVIRFDREKCTWHLVGSAEEEANRRAQAERQNNIIIRTAKALIAEEPYQWSGTATELVKKIADITERAYPGSSTALGKELTRLESDLYDEGVDHKSVRSSQGTLHSFTRRQYYQREQCTSQPTAFDGGPFDEERCPDKTKS